MPGTNMLDEVANDLALWIDQTANQIALAFAPARAPFAAPITEEQKLEYYRSKLFNPDGSPNAQGRSEELARLGAQGFGQVYKAVIKAYPDLRVPTPPEITVPQQWPTLAPPAGAGTPVPPPTLPRGVTTVPMRTPGLGPIPHMAGGGVVTQPTLALIGEAGPEAVVPLGRDPGFSRYDQQVSPNVDPGFTQGPMLGTGSNNDPGFTLGLADYQYQQPNYFSGYTPPQPGEIESYIRQASMARGIDPDVATKVAYWEGGRDPKNPNQPAFTDPAVRADFPTGSSWWPFQLHYGGQGYEHYGTQAGMGNDFTAQTGYQPGDPAAWRASVDYALDQAPQVGWGRWYGSRNAKVGEWQGLPRRNA